MRIIILALFIVSCSPLRHYSKVASDPFRNSAERNLLSQACIAEFPTLADTPRVVFSGVDSSDYLAVALAYNQLVDSLIAHEERDTAFTIYKYHVVDSLRIIRAFLKTYHPPAVIKTEIREVRVTNTAMENQLQTTIDNCRRENDGLIVQAKTAKDARQTAMATKWWLIAIGGLLLFGNVYQLVGKKSLV